MALDIVGAGAKYPTAFRDADGEFLSGGASYRLRVPARVPVNNFWSVTVYDALTASGLDNGQPWLSRNPAIPGYTKGVPMGGDLHAAPKGKAPAFLVAALKDPIGANLDRIQIVKGWLDKSGKLHEKVHDVAWSGNRKPDPKTGKLPSVGNTVDVANATWSNTIGAPELIAVWKDPSFDPAERAFYYARVIEIPIPRWTAYDAKRFGIKMPSKVPMTTTERAYTSPIWYTPGS